MNPRPWLVALMTSVLLPGLAHAQTSDADVTFEIPLNLTGLSSALGKVGVRCEIESTAFRSGSIDAYETPQSGRWYQQEFCVTKGQVVQTAQVVIAIAANDLHQPAGKMATYKCWLRGYDITTHSWREMHNAGLGPPFQILPLPAPISGSFWW